MMQKKKNIESTLCKFFLGGGGGGDRRRPIINSHLI